MKESEVERELSYKRHWGGKRGRGGEGERGKEGRGEGEGAKKERACKRNDRTRNIKVRGGVVKQTAKETNRNLLSREFVLVSHSTRGGEGVVDKFHVVKEEKGGSGDRKERGGDIKEECVRVREREREGRESGEYFSQAVKNVFQKRHQKE